MKVRCIHNKLSDINGKSTREWLKKNVIRVDNDDHEISHYEIGMKYTVYGLVSYAWSGIGASFGPAIVLLIFWKKLSRAGVFASLITGTLSAVIWKTWLVEPTGISERLASYVLAFSLAVVFSLLFPEDSSSKKIH